MASILCGFAGGLWVGGTENEVVSTRLLPKLQVTEEKHSKLLFEVSTMQVCCCRGRMAWSPSFMLLSRAHGMSTFM